MELIGFMVWRRSEEFGRKNFIVVLPGESIMCQIHGLWVRKGGR